MTDLTGIIPAGEMVWITYFSRDTLLFVLTGPENMTSSLTAQNGAFTLYAVKASARGEQKLRKLGSGGNPMELEDKYSIAEKMKEYSKVS